MITDLITNTHRDYDISCDLLSVDLFGLIASESMTICALIDAIDDSDFRFPIERMMMMTINVNVCV